MQNRHPAFCFVRALFLVLVVLLLIESGTQENGAASAAISSAIAERLGQRHLICKEDLSIPSVKDGVHRRNRDHLSVLRGKFPDPGGYIPAGPGIGRGLRRLLPPDRASDSFPPRRDCRSYLQRSSMSGHDFDAVSQRRAYDCTAFVPDADLLQRRPYPAAHTLQSSIFHLPSCILSGA